MAQNIKLKRSSVSGKVPTTSNLEAGELAINTADGKVFFERDDNTVQGIFTTNALTTGSLWQSGSDSYFLSNVGIKTTNPSRALEVRGMIVISGSYENLSDPSYAGLLFSNPQSNDTGLIRQQDNSGGLILSSTEYIIIKPNAAATHTGTNVATFSTASIDFTKDLKLTDSNLTVSGALDVSGSSTFDGNVTITGNILASNLGSASQPITGIFVKSGTVTFVSASTTAQLSTDFISPLFESRALGYATGSAGYIAVFEDDRGVSGSVMYQSGTSIGIGTTSPSTTLDVTGNLKVSTIAAATTDTDRFLVSDAGVLKYRTGTQILSDIGGQTAGNYVTDNGGASGEVGVWSSATALSGSSALYWNGANLGIGTSSPSDKLVVEENVAGSVRIVLKNPNPSGFATWRWFVGPGASATAAMYQAASNGNWTIQNAYTGSYIRFQTTDFANVTGNALLLNPDRSIEFSEQQVYITSSNVGIGNSVPPQKLTVQGSISASGDLYLDGALYDTTNSAGTSGQILQSTGTGTDWVDLAGLSVEAFQVYASIKNVSGTTLYKGTPVHAVSGSSLGNVNPVIAASASVASNMPATFILNEDLADQAEGLGIAVGFISGVNTSAFSVGDIVYVGQNGGYTNVKPTGSANLIQNLGVVTKVHASNGAGYVYGSGRSNDVPNLPVGKIWVGSPTYSVTSSVVHLDEANGRVGINTTVPSYALDVNAANIRVGVHTIGIAGSAVTSSLAIGQDALGSYSGTSGNTAVGWKALSLITGGPNDAIGAEAMRYSVGATYNTAIGVAAGYRSQGTQNTFIGQFSGPYYHDLTEGFNTFIGPLVGLFSSGSARQNTGIGAGAIYNLITANSNTAVGSAAGFELTTGGFNTFLGDQAGRGVTTGAKNTIIGRVTGLAPTLTKAIIIGDGDGTVRYRYDNTVDNTFISSSLTTSGFISASGLIYAPNIGAGVDNSVVILDSDGTLRTDEIDSRVWGTSLVDGSGATNRVAYWSDTNTLTSDADFLFDGTNVGIGNTAPPQKLTVQGNISASGDLYLGNNATGTLWFGSTAGTVAKIAGSSVLDFYSDDLVSFIESDSGTVKIAAGLNNGTFNINTTGEYNASIKLFVNGATRFNGDSTVTGNLTVDGRVTAQEFHTEFVSASIIYQSGSTKFGDTSDDNHDFTGQVHVYRNATIGSPSSFTAANAGLRVQDNANSMYFDGNAIVADGAGNFEIGTTQNTGMFLFTSGSERMRIAADGNVGIGTTSPSVKLEIADSIPVLRITGTRDASWTIGQTMASLEYFSEDASGTAANSVRASINLVNETSVFGSTTGLSFSTKGDVAGLPTERMRITAAGNVGIGTTTPGYKLEILGSPTNAIINLAKSDGDQYLRFTGGSGGANQLIQTLYNLGIDTGGAGNRTMTLLSDGNVGIGTTSPSCKLDVESSDDILASFVSTDNKASIEIKDNDTTVYVSAENSRASFGFNVGVNANNLNVDTSGNVGIGTSSPSQKLDVVGSAQVSGQFAQGVTIANKVLNYGAEFRSSGASIQIVMGRDTNATGSGGIGADENAIFSAWNIDSGASEKFRIAKSGAIQAYYYGSGNVTGTAAYALAVDSSGNIIEIETENTNNGQNTDIDTGTEVVDSFASGSGNAAFTNYVINNGTNYRAGQLMSVWNTSGTIEYTDVSTNSIGDTSEVVIFSSINAADVEIQATVPSDNWTIKITTTIL